ncbi:MAG TPA: hypothetical protein VEY92_06435 [Pseudoxanthomonas sp.]|nr:hypothetical protein [Pseudoxanthomonas sp.]
MNEKRETKLVEIILVKPHTHAGKDHAAGDKLEVDEPTAKWLADNQIINIPAAPVAAKEGAK